MLRCAESSSVTRVMLIHFRNVLKIIYYIDNSMKYILRWISFYMILLLITLFKQGPPDPNILSPPSPSELLSTTLFWTWSITNYCVVHNISPNNTYIYHFLLLVTFDRCVKYNHRRRHIIVLSGLHVICVDVIMQFLTTSFYIWLNHPQQDHKLLDERSLAIRRHEKNEWTGNK